MKNKPNIFLLPLMLLILLFNTSWLEISDLGIWVDLANTNVVGVNRSITITSAAPISIYGRIDNPSYGISNYNLEVFLDTDGDGFPTPSDGSSWVPVSTIYGWSQTTIGLLFRSSILTTNVLTPGSNYIVRVWAMNNFGVMSADTNIVNWVSETDATTNKWLPHHWFAVKIITDLKPGKTHR